MPLSIGKSVIYHPQRVSHEALGSKIRITTKMYAYPDGSHQRVWGTHVVEAKLRDTSPPPPESSAGAFMRMSTKDYYVFELCQSADYDTVTKELLPRYAARQQRLLAEYETGEHGAALIALVKEHANTAPTLYLEASASKHIIAEGDTLLVQIVGCRQLYEPLGHITDIEILD